MFWIFSSKRNMKSFVERMKGSGCPIHKKRDFLAELLPSLQGIVKMGLPLFLAVTVVAQIKMAESIQRTFKTPERNAIGAAGAFLVPIGQIFQFLEDTVTVKVNYSIAQGTKAKTHTIFWTGIRGALLSGTAVAIILTILAVSDTTLPKILAPGAENDLKLYPNCNLIPGSAQEVAATVRKYFIIQSWTFPLSYTVLVFTGLIIGSMQLSAWAYSMLMGETTLLLVWFLTPLNDRTSELLGWAYFAQAAVPVICFFSFFTSSTPFRDYTGVSFMRTQHEPQTARDVMEAADGKEYKSPRISQEQRALIIDGLRVMMLDLCLTLASTITYYVALSHSAATTYELNALQSATPAFGVSYTFAIAYFAKILGAQFMGRGTHTHFRTLIHITMAAVFVIMVIQMSLIFSEIDAVAYYFSKPACEFAGTESCAPLYRDIFLANDNVRDVFVCFAPIVAIVSAFNPLRAFVSVCLDFDFMCRSAVAAFVFGFVPAICITTAVGTTATGLYISQNMPIIILTVIFAIRLRCNLHKMDAGIDGPWSKTDKVKNQADSDISNNMPIQCGDMHPAYAGETVNQARTKMQEGRELLLSDYHDKDDGISD